MILSFTPPKNWQDFELLSKEVAKKRFDCEFDMFGRAGQKQDGIDVIGVDKEYQHIGIQCKHKKADAPKSKKIHLTISKKVIEEEIKKADGLKPPLNKLIVATTSFRDAVLQRHISAINLDRTKRRLFGVELWTWETFEEELNNHPELSYLYYDKILKTYKQYDKDLHILHLLTRAFKRPAFLTPFHVENNSEDFLQAVKDTQRAFNTGKLYDRDKNLLASAYAADKLSKPDDKTEAVWIETKLQELRDYTTKQIADGNIKQMDNFLEFPYNWKHKVADNLNDRRAEILKAFNQILKRNGLSEISSALIH
jgi:hypothetical protein